MNPKKKGMRLPSHFLFLLFAVMLSGFMSKKALAQMDPTTEMLLSPAVGDEQKAGLQSGRYEVHSNVDSGPSEAVREPADANTRSESVTPEYKIRLKKNTASKAKKTAKKQAAEALPSKKVSTSEKSISEEPMVASTVVSAPATMPVIPSPTLPPLAQIRVKAISTTTTSSSTTTSTTSSTSTTAVAVATTTTLPEIVVPVQAKAETLVVAPAPAPTTTLPTPIPVVAPEQAPTWSEQIKELVYSPPKEIQEYKEQIHPDDNRINQIEINLMPGVLSVNSKSNLDYRDYKTTSPGWLIGGEFWLTPFMGIYGSYTSSVSGDVLGDPATDDHITAQHEWTEIGFDLRKYFGMSRKANSITYGVDYVGYKFKVPSDSTYREGISSNAIGFHLQGRVPVSPYYAWTFGGRVAPRVNVSESNTALVLSSGSSPQSMKIGANVGGEFKMSRENQLIWQLSVSYEKIRYGDKSSLADPGTGAVINGVTVDSTTTFLQFGYRWGQ